MSPRKFLLSFLLVVSCAAPAADLEEPWGFAHGQLQSKGYLAALTALESRESRYLESQWRNEFLQAMAVHLSFLGRYAEAIRYFDSMGGEGPCPVPGELELSNLEPVDAVEAVTQAAAARQAVFINEAHHVPQNRALTLRLLEPLYRLGFRYFAAETLTHGDEGQLNERKFPIRATGYFTVEPLYADIVRRALEIGYKVVAYEHEGECDYKKTPEKCQEERERGQAGHLIRKILKKDPTARFLVHAGYGHIDKIGGTKFFPWVPMARYFKEASGIDPLTVDQTEMIGHSLPKHEDPSYTQAVGHFHPVRPMALREKDKGTWWTGSPGHYDIQIFSPRLGDIPDFRDGLEGRARHSAPVSLCASFPCLIQAFAEKEAGAEAIALDQVLLRRKAQATLYLRPGKYTFRASP